MGIIDVTKLAWTTIYGTKGFSTTHNTLVVTTATKCVRQSPKGSWAVPSFPFHHLLHHLIITPCTYFNTWKMLPVGLLPWDGEWTWLIMLDTVISAWFCSEVSSRLGNSSKLTKLYYLYYRTLWKRGFICLSLSIVIQFEIQNPDVNLVAVQLVTSGACWNIIP